MRIRQHLTLGGALVAALLVAACASSSGSKSSGGGSSGSGSSGSSSSGSSGSGTAANGSGTTADPPKRDPMVALGGAFSDYKASKSEMSLNDERDLGETVALQAYATPDFGKPIHNKKLMRYVNTLLSVIARTSDRPLIPFFVAVIDTPKINAFACPGGYIFVTRGALEAMQTEGELACVLGHEVAHITEKHALQTIKRTKQFTAGGKVLAALSDTDPDELDKMVKDLCNSLLNNAFDRDKEIKADVRGVEFARRAGYDPRAMLAFLDRLETKKDLLSPGFSSHPKTADRKKEIQKALSKLKPTDLTGLANDVPRFAQVKGWLKEPQEPWPADPTTAPSPAAPAKK